MKKQTKVAVAQLTPVFLNKDKTIDKACEAIIKAGEEGAELILFPELHRSVFTHRVEPGWSCPGLYMIFFRHIISLYCLLSKS